MMMMMMIRMILIMMVIRSEKEDSNFKSTVPSSIFTSTAPSKTGIVRDRYRDSVKRNMRFGSDLGDPEIS